MIDRIFTAFTAVSCSTLQVGCAKLQVGCAKLQVGCVMLLGGCVMLLGGCAKLQVGCAMLLGGCAVLLGGCAVESDVGQTPLSLKASSGNDGLEVTAHYGELLRKNVSLEEQNVKLSAELESASAEIKLAQSRIVELESKIQQQQTQRDDLQSLLTSEAKSLRISLEHLEAAAQADTQVADELRNEIGTEAPRELQPAKNEPSVKPTQLPKSEAPESE